MGIRVFVEVRGIGKHIVITCVIERRRFVGHYRCAVCPARFARAAVGLPANGQRSCRRAARLCTVNAATHSIIWRFPLCDSCRRLVIRRASEPEHMSQRTFRFPPLRGGPRVVAWRPPDRIPLHSSRTTVAAQRTHNTTPLRVPILFTADRNSFFLSSPCHFAPIVATSWASAALVLGWMLNQKEIIYLLKRRQLRCCWIFLLLTNYFYL